MNRRGFLTGLASLVVPVPSTVTAPFVVDCGGRVGGIRAGSFISRGTRLTRMPDGTFRAEGVLRDFEITGTITV